MTPRGREGPIVGGLLVLLGVLALREGWRLRELRETLVAGAVVGDDTFPLVIGVALVVLGAYMILLARLSSPRVDFPRGRVGGRMLVGAGAMVGYWFLAPWLGYTAATAVVALALYRGLGGYRWPAALALAAVSTAALYLMFRVWLLQPLPSGVLGG
ncbi:MAG TPA: tripartite tricarboxylate transporter TctB family protein [Methylomirabilota bacterium]|nr:tripartite tricarboxylate transporter TctB family protein [Methylomirabilota bacterium]